MRQNNLIRGVPPVFGCRWQIDWLKKKNRIMSGEINCHTISWIGVHYWGAHNETGKPIYNFQVREDALMDNSMVCPRCERRHVLLYAMSNPQLQYQSGIEIDAQLEEEGFSCWNCGLEFVVDERDVYVKQEENE